MQDMLINCICTAQNLSNSNFMDLFMGSNFYMFIDSESKFRDWDNCGASNLKFLDQNIEKYLF